MEAKRAPSAAVHIEHTLPSYATFSGPAFLIQLSMQILLVKGRLDSVRNGCEQGKGW